MALMKGYRDKYLTDFVSHTILHTVEGPKALIFNADEIYMNSILTNLINNAKDALIDHDAESKEIFVFVDEGDTEEKKYIRVRIQDNGPGIPENHLDEIFETFFSTKPTSGTGFGRQPSVLVEFTK